MANRYWVGGTATWDGTAGTKWSTTSGGAGGSSIPTAADDVFFSAGSGSGTVTLSASSVCRSLNCTGFTGTLSHPNSITVSIGDATAGASNVALKIVSGMTYTRGGTSSYFSFISTSATQQTIDSGGKTLGRLTINGVGSSYILSAALTAAYIDLFAGALDTNNYNVTLTSFYISTSNTKTLTLGSSTITIDTEYSYTNSGLTLNCGTSTIALSPASGSVTFTGGGVTYYNVTYTAASSGQLTISGSNTYNNLTLTGAATPLSGAYILWSRTQTINGTLTITGNSATNRFFVISTLQGSTTTINAAAVSLTNVHFEDVTAAGAAIPFTGTSISGVANISNITVTTPVTRYWVGNGGNWSDTAHWSTSSGGATGASVPLPQDTAIFNASSFSSGSQTVTIDVIFLASNINFTGATNTPTLAINTYTNAYVYENLTLIAAMATSGTTDLNIRTNSSATITTNNLDLARDVYVMARSGTYTMGSNFKDTGAGNILILAGGILDANDYTMTLRAFGSDTSDFQGYSKTLYMGSGTWSISGTGTCWDTGNTISGGLTIYAETSTIDITDTSATAKTLDMGGKTYNNLTITGDNITIQDSNTFNVLAVNTAGRTNGLKITSGTTQTITSMTTNGSAGSLAKLSASTAASAFSLSKSSGIVSVDYMSIQDSTATGGAGWYAGAHSTNVSGNTGWQFEAAIQPTSLSATTAIGSPSVKPNVHINGIASTLSMGVPRAYGGADVLPDTLASTLVFGTPTLTAGAAISATGIASTVAFGNLTIFRSDPTSTVYAKASKNKSVYVKTANSDNTYTKASKNRTTYAN